MESIEELAVVHADGRFVIRSTNRLFEISYVTGQRLVVDRQLGRSADDFARAQVAAQQKDRLRERMPGMFLIRFRPEESQQLVAADASVSGDGEDGQQREPPMLRERAVQTSRVVVQRDAPKSSQPEHLPAGGGKS